jgi:putative spermidine/putrescine transport system substrate-binding protein
MHIRTYKVATGKAVAIAAASILALSACGSKTTKASDASAAAAALGKGEGALNVVAWAGYTEKDWVDPFVADSGCKVNVKTANTSDEMVTLMQSGEYDIVSASGDASLRLIASGEVVEIKPDLIPSYAGIFEGLKLKAWNSKDGKPYGVPHGRGVNVLMYNKDKFPTPPDSWSIVFDANSPAKGSVTAYDAPIYIADAAIYLMSTKPDLGIKNPYALDDTQFAAAIDLLKVQKGLVSEYWSDYTKQIAAFKTGSMTVGTSWQVIANTAQADKVNVDVVVPKEGATAWSDTWMLSSKAKNPNCGYMWMNYITSPKANAMATEFYGEAPSSAAACGMTTNKEHCKIFHAEDEAYFEKLWYWTTPTKDCLDGRGPKCKDFAEWTKAWTEVKG